MPKKKSKGLPDLTDNTQEEPTRPMPLQELPEQVRVDHEMAIVREHHERIAKAIEGFWGRKDCTDYLQQLIFSGGDGVGRTRIGFKHEVLSALINLTDLHEAQQR